MLFRSVKDELLIVLGAQLGVAVIAVKAVADTGITDNGGLGHAVQGHAEGVLVDDGFVQQVIQVLTGNLADLLELQQLVLDVGADLLAVVLPLTGRALEVIGNVVEL